MKIHSMNYILDIDDHDTVDSIKLDIFRKYKIPVDSQIIYFRNSKCYLFFNQKPVENNLQPQQKENIFKENEKFKELMTCLNSGGDFTKLLKDDEFNKLIVGNMTDYLDQVFNIST